MSVSIVRLMKLDEPGELVSIWIVQSALDDEMAKSVLAERGRLLIGPVAYNPIGKAVEESLIEGLRFIGIDVKPHEWGEE